MRISGKIFLALVLAGSLLSLRAAARSAYDDALDKYKSGLFQQAASGFSACLVREPSNQLCHYLLANSLVRLGEHSRAAQEYQVAYLIDPASSTGEFCRQALLAYKKAIPPSSKAGAAHAGVADTAELEKVKSLIRRQAGFEKEKHNSVVVRSEHSIRSQVDDDLRRVDEWMESEIQKLNDPLVYNPGPRANPLLGNPELLKQKEDQIRATAQMEKERIIKAAGERSQVYESWRKDKEALLDEAAGNLQTQLDQPAGRSGVKLQAHGTGLYVRNYGKGGPNLLPDPHQATVRIQEAGVGSRGDEEGADTQKQNEPAGKDVKGKVVN